MGNEKDEFKRIIMKAVNRHLVMHVQTESKLDRIELLADEAADEIIDFKNKQHKNINNEPTTSN
jgi:hypothetical protein